MAWCTINCIYCLTHWGRVTHICVGKLTAWTAPSHYLNQCWNIVNWTLGSKLQWDFNRNSNIFIEENTFENAVCEMWFISSGPQCVNLHYSYLLQMTYSNTYFWMKIKNSKMICCTLHGVIPGQPFCITGPLCKESVSGYWWNPSTNGQ